MWLLVLIVVAVCALPLVAIVVGFNPQPKIDDYGRFDDEMGIKSIETDEWKKRYGEVDTKNDDSQNS